MPRSLSDALTVSALATYSGRAFQWPTMHPLAEEISAQLKTTSLCQYCYMCEEGVRICLFCLCLVAEDIYELYQYISLSQFCCVVVDGITIS